MEKADFKPETLEAAEQYAAAIIGALAFSWGVPLAKMKDSRDKDMEFTTAQILFLLKDEADRSADA